MCPKNPDPEMTQIRKDLKLLVKDFERLKKGDLPEPAPRGKMASLQFQVDDLKQRLEAKEEVKNWIIAAVEERARQAEDDYKYLVDRLRLFFQGPTPVEVRQRFRVFQGWLMAEFAGPKNMAEVKGALTCLESDIMGMFDSQRSTDLLDGLRNTIAQLVAQGEKITRIRLSKLKHDEIARFFAKTTPDQKPVQVSHLLGLPVVIDSSLKPGTWFIELLTPPTVSDEAASDARGK